MGEERLGSRFGFLLMCAGCAIGLGNVWKFPYMVGEYGGGIFVLIYLFFLAILGIPLVLAELSIGRGAGCSPVRMLERLRPEVRGWRHYRLFAFLGPFLLMSFYTVIAGWILHYFLLSATGAFEGMGTSEVGDMFGTVSSDPITSALFMIIIVITGALICSAPLQKGMERITKYMMTALLALMAILVVNSVFLPGASEGLDFYLLPHMEAIEEHGILNIMVAAMSQAFFTLSVGIGSMAIFGSYINKDRKLLGEATNIAVLDTSVAIMAGLILFPACFTYGVDVGAGPNLLFITLPNIFNHMPLGELWGPLFFLFMTFAAFSTVITVFEDIGASLRDLFGWDRKRSSIVMCVSVILLAMPCVLGFSIFSGFVPFAEGSSILDVEDFLVSYIMLPIGSLILLMFCVSRCGWGWKGFSEEANSGEGRSIGRAARVYMTYVLPVLVTILIVIGLVTYNYGL